MVVVFGLLSSFNSLYLSFRMYWAWLEQVGRSLVPFLIAQIFGGPLERVPLRSSGVYTLSAFCASAKLLQVPISHSSGFPYARAGHARAGTLALERVFDVCKITGGV